MRLRSDSGTDLWAGAGVGPRPDGHLAVEGLRVDLTGRVVNVVEDVGFAVAGGEILGVVGESGSGKTTVAAAILGHARPGAAIVGGSVRVDDVDVLSLSDTMLEKYRGRRATYVPQDPATALNPALRIRTQLRELVEIHEPGVPHDTRDSRIAATLEDANLPSDHVFLARYPHQLSGGQQQRICIAMAFLLRPDVIVLDEPTTGLDVTTQARILETIRTLCAERGVAAVYVTHDLAVVAQLADRVAVMYAGRIVEIGPTRALIDEPRHPYTALLTAAIPSIATRSRLQPIPGHAPAPGARPGGCAFHDRCPLRVARCVQEIPPLLSRGPAHSSACHRAEAVSSIGGSEAGLLERPVVPRRAAVLSVRGLRCAYGPTVVLDDVSLQLGSGECLAIVGESGSGKTTLARAVVGLHARQAGDVELNGRSLAALSGARTPEERRAIQFVFQNPYASLNPRKSVRQTLGTVVRHFFSVGRSEVAARVGEALESVSMPARVLDVYPDQLSGGERQRVAIARALACDPLVLICDEITSALDVSVQASIINLLEKLREERELSMLFVTHDLALVRSIADRVAVLDRGHMVEIGDTDQVLDSPKDEYTRRLRADTPGDVRRSFEAPRVESPLSDPLPPHSPEVPHD